MTVNVGLARENDNHLQSFADSECLAPGFDASGICIDEVWSDHVAFREF